jgi:hypothetical protein
VSVHPRAQCGTAGRTLGGGACAVTNNGWRNHTDQVADARPDLLLRQPGVAPGRGEVVTEDYTGIGDTIRLCQDHRRDRTSPRRLITSEIRQRCTVNGER